MTNWKNEKQTWKTGKKQKKVEEECFAPPSRPRPAGAKFNFASGAPGMLAPGQIWEDFELKMMIFENFKIEPGSSRKHLELMVRSTLPPLGAASKSVGGVDLAFSDL